jgi:opacity protein-like surface antigen
VPLLKDQRLAKSLTLDLAGRYTDYSTSGGVETWKAGLAYQPIPDLALRASVSRDIRAPDLNALYEGRTATTSSTPDPFTGVSSGFLQVTTGNPNLKPERALTETFGFTYTPSPLPGFTATADYYNIRIDDAIEVVSAPQELQDCYASGPAYNSPYCSLIIRPYPISNTSPANYPTEIITDPVNVSVFEQSGIDFTPNYIGQLSALNSSWSGTYQIGATAQFLLSGNETPALGLPSFSTAGYGTNQRIKGSVVLGLNHGPVSVHVTNRFTGISSRAIPGSAPNTQVYGDNPDWPNRVYTDLDVTYRIREGIDAFFHVKNLFDVLGPFYGTYFAAGFSSSTNPEIYDLIGTTFTAGVRMRLGAGSGETHSAEYNLPVVSATGLYASLGAGIDMVQSQNFRLRQPVLSGGFATAPTANANVGFTTGGMVMPTLGYKWDGGLRTEFEFSSSLSGISSFNDGPNPTGHQETFGLMGNVLYDFKTGASFTPYVGAGIGAGVVRWRYVTGDVDPQFLDSHIGFQWQGIAGISRPVFDHTEAYLEYHYVRDSSGSFESHPWMPALGIGSLASDYKATSSEVILGLRYTF